MLVLKYWEKPARDLYNAAKHEIYCSDSDLGVSSRRVV
jgi:hypothetical protein